MKNIKILNIIFIFIFVITIVLAFVIKNDIFTYLFSCLFISFFLLKRFIFISNLKVNVISFKINVSNRERLLSSIIPVLLFVLLVLNFFYGFISSEFSSRLFFLVVGFTLIIDVIYGLNEYLVITDKFFAYKNTFQYIMRDKITEYAIENSSLMIRSPHDIFWIKFHKLPYDKIGEATSIINEKLERFINGKLIFDNKTISIIEN